MPAKQVGKQFEVIGCASSCSFNPARIGMEKAEALNALLGRFPTERLFIENAAKLHVRISKGSFYNHTKNHVREVVPEQKGDVLKPEEEVEGLSHLDILEMIIKQGARGLGNQRVSSRDLMEAMKLFYQLTKGSAFKDLEDALLFGDDDGPADEGDLEESEGEPGEIREPAPADAASSGADNVAEQG